MGAMEHETNSSLFHLIINHQIEAGFGAVRAHGSRGAFAMRLLVEKESLRVLDCAELVQSSQDIVIAAPSSFAPQKGFSRLCSSDLAEKSAIFNPKTGKGSTDRLYLVGEEE